jgi:hypothetical protein
VREADCASGRRVNKEAFFRLNRVRREMRNFHGVFGLGDFTNFGEDAV